MAETTVLRSSAQTKKTNPTGAAPSAKLSGAHPTVSVTMGSGGKPVQEGRRGNVPRNVQILPPRAPRPLPGMAATAPAPVGFTSEQLLLARHLFEKYATEQRAEGGSDENAKLADDTIATIDRELAGLAALAALPAPGPRPVVVSSGSKAPSVQPSGPRRSMRPEQLPPVVVQMVDGQPAAPEAAGAPQE